MNSNNETSIRAFGQRTIASAFRNFPPRNPLSEGSVRSQASHKSDTSHSSLSNFLSFKQQKSPHLPQPVPGKSTPFLSPLGLRKWEENGTVKKVEKEGNSNNDSKVIFESFKHTEEDKRDFVRQIGVDELENSVADNNQDSKKRKIRFEEYPLSESQIRGGKESQTARKHVVVLGGESKLKPKRQIENGSGNKRPRPLYNHYANGHGWWDYDMEGVDNEQLGSNEVWEGVGSTTLGGIIDWH
ncbi:hypothetical protein PHAVU_007G134400 [Phaseolus vulgaris]|uniref:Uncharacterized protein n=1 Tax=Phaseolus vulgaris TaxID=3885 RepID=V7BH13_PHAVU|nr:hypothetical protein PHAVU_007G134400g [Phaseolus vulgaris]ESW16163.1 hypothetical protein PHAVU_007G134400g [Phaseolus vulgaris]